jgi:enolase-phosphatase E1
MKIVLLDIEGTTTPVAFVYEVLFPFAWRRIAAYMGQHWNERELLDIRARLALEHAKEEPSPGFDIATLPGAVGYAAWLMEHDRKSTGLKYLQGLIWNEGYREGALRGDVFPDVPFAIERWHRAGVIIAIYSSGSVLAQRLLFASTAAGDLTPMITGFFDTNVGPKTDPQSYARIAAALDAYPPDITFVSDAPAELAAAAKAGCHAVLCVRPGNAQADPAPEHLRTGEPAHQVIHSFDELA